MAVLEQLQLLQSNLKISLSLPTPANNIECDVCDSTSSENLDLPFWECACSYSSDIQSIRKEDWREEWRKSVSNALSFTLVRNGTLYLRIPCVDNIIVSTLSDCTIMSTLHLMICLKIMKFNDSLLVVAN